ncbi:hypothetical protein N0V90_007358 [Kalmusia sp. IMI 367209]|nr:hypothetical protein N0V90_007358 [Kalmusia sp. IMI 367209]
MSSIGGQPSQQNTQRGNSAHDSPVERLVHWFKADRGELNPDVEIVYSDSSGYHCRAARELSSSVVAKCPLSLTLSHLNLDHTQSIVPHVESPLAKCLGQVPNSVLTYLLLIEQRLSPDKHRLRWYPYIACLPEPDSMTTPLWFSDEDMQCLAGTNLAQETSVKLDQLTKKWNQAIEVMKRVGVDSEIFSFEWFLWAATIISSRAFISTHILPDEETFPILFPVVDILNHSPTANVEWDFHPLQDFTLKVLGYDGIRPGDELFNNYAPKQNDELLLGYGFCVEDNPVEQFAIKMRLPSPVEQAARSMKLFEPSNVPFGMDTSFLKSDLKDEPQYLRPKGHPFGRYMNQIPFFQGIPSSIVHTFFIKALMNLNMQPSDAYKGTSPAPRLVLEVLLLLYEAIDQRSRTLPLSLENQRTSPKQKHAGIYRDGQARIIHAIRTELKAAIDSFRWHEGMEHREPGPRIFSTTEALIHLITELPAHAAQFTNALSEQFGIHVSNFAQYGRDIASLEVEDRPAELYVWKLLLCLFAVVHSQNLDNGAQSMIRSWNTDLIAQHPLPDDADGVDAEPLQEFILGVQGEGERVARAYVWADEIVDRFAFPLVEGNEDLQRICMFLQAPGRQ